MRFRASLPLLVASLAILFTAAAAGGPSRAEAAVYWGYGGFLGASNADGSNFVDGVPYGAANVPEIGDVCGVAVGGGYLYWADRGRGSIGRTELGTNPTGLVDFFKESVALDESFISGLVSPCGVAVDGGHIYWASPGGMVIGRANLDGSAPDRTFISGVSSPCGVAVDGAHVYWGSLLGGSVGRAGLGGGEVDEGFVEGLEGPCGVAVDGTHVYWANWLGSTIGRAEMDGGSPDDAFIAGLHNPCGVAVDGSHVYWTNWNSSDPFGRAGLDGSGVVMPRVTDRSYGASCGIALDSKTLKGRPLPLSAPIFLGRIRRGEGRGVAYVNVKVPKTGGVVEVVSKALDWGFVGSPVPERGYLLRQLKVWPARAGRAAHKLRSRLARNGHANVYLEVTHLEAGKGPYLASMPLTLIKRGGGERR